MADDDVDDDGDGDGDELILLLVRRRSDRQSQSLHINLITYIYNIRVYLAIFISAHDVVCPLVVSFRFVLVQFGLVLYFALGLGHDNLEHLFVHNMARPWHF